jgi:zinc transporter ZupT
MMTGNLIAFISAVIISFVMTPWARKLAIKVGAVFGALVGGISDYFIAFCLSAAASSMLYVSANELIPEANILHKGKSSSLMLLLGFMAGCYMSFGV